MAGIKLFCFNDNLFLLMVVSILSFLLVKEKKKGRRKEEETKLRKIELTFQLNCKNYAHGHFIIVF